MNKNLEKLINIRKMTGISLNKCKNALIKCNWNIEKAMSFLHKLESTSIIPKNDNNDLSGIIYSYIHTGNSIGVMLEIYCKTDFVTKNHLFLTLAKDISLQIAAMNPIFIAKENIEIKFFKKELKIIFSTIKNKSIKKFLIKKIFYGQMDNLYKKLCLLNQLFIKNESLTVNNLILKQIMLLKENIFIKRFVRFQIGDKKFL